MKMRPILQFSIVISSSVTIFVFLALIQETELSNLSLPNVFPFLTDVSRQPSGLILLFCFCLHFWFSNDSVISIL